MPVNSPSHATSDQASSANSHSFGRLLQAWSHCGLTVRGIWQLHLAAESRNSNNDDHYRFIIVQSGEITYRTQIKSITIRAGQCCLAQPGLASTMQSPGECSLLDIRFSALPAAAAATPWSLIQLPVVVQTKAPSPLVHLHHRMQGTRWATPNDAMEARFALDRCLYESLRDGLQPAQVNVQPLPAWLADAITAANTHLKKPSFDVHAFATLAGCSIEHLNRSLQKHFQSTTHAFLRKLRIQRASHIIRHEPSMVTKDVARQCGYANLRTFRKHWQQEMQQGLRQFRNQTLGKI